MRRLALAAALAALAGCPLPQPLPVVQRDGQAVTPPRIIVQTVQPASALVLVRGDCLSGEAIPFDAEVEDADLDDTVEARWFVNYSPQASGIAFTDFPAAAEDGVNPVRGLREFRFEPAVYAAAEMHHVVELVVSNGFYPPNTPGLAEPNRSAQAGYETQVFRWFVAVDPAGRCQ